MRAFQASDRRDRDRAVLESGRSFLVEAAAGTGKTQTLIDRIICLVLNSEPGKEPLFLSQIAAITFTEKAAGEMKVRLREQFERLAAEPSGRGERAQQALRDLEGASISTIHSFAVSLLKERPIEAGLDPRFRALDAIESDLLFREVWRQWLARAIQQRSGPLERALRGGLSLAQLQDLANDLRLHARAVTELPLGSVPSEEEVRHTITALKESCARYQELNKDESDKLADHLETTRRWLDAWPSPAAIPERPRKTGKTKNWSGGEETLEQVRQFIREVVEFASHLSDRNKQLLLVEVVEWLRVEFLGEWSRRKLSQGLLDFDDQLGYARDLLRSRPAARHDFQQKFRTLLVDEFQDTDPIQLEIALLLSSNKLDERDPAKLHPDPGRLFIVGDPKQSIYRFRGADIETYLRLEGSSGDGGEGMEVLRLSKNFRSVPSILRFVDSIFSQVMERSRDGFYQPDYLAFIGEGERRQEPPGPAVHVLSNWDEGLEAFSARQCAEDEARRIARLIRLIVRRPDTRWRIWVSRDGVGDHRTWQDPTFGDIAILLPVFSRVAILEEALRDAEVPFVLEGGKFYYARGEVSSAITILRAVENPNDAVALYGSLRSVFFGLSDEDLLRMKMDGLRLDYRTEVPEHSPARAPYHLLRELHRSRHGRPASETFETLLERTGVREILASRPGGVQSLANLNKLARTLRARQSDLTFSEVVALLSGMDEEELDESESRVVEERSDAVRVLSIHRSKGLDFPIVFVAGLGIQRKTRLANFLADPHESRIFAVSVGSGNRKVQSPEWKRLQDREVEREKAELIRLLYVALTRSRDHLVLSTHVKWKKNRSEGAEPNFSTTRLEPICPALRKILSDKQVEVDKVDVKALDAMSEPPPTPPPAGPRDYAEILRREYEEIDLIRTRTPKSVSIKSPSDTDVEESLTEDFAVSQGWSVRLGTAFHDAMQMVDLMAENKISVCAALAAERQGMHSRCAREVEEMMTRAWSSDLLERAREALRAGRRLERELPFVRALPQEGGVASVVVGKIDLIFEEPEGWVVVDYKTDGLPREEPDVSEYFHRKYSGQVGEYAAALRHLGMKVKAAYLLLARTGESIPIQI